MNRFLIVISFLAAALAPVASQNLSETIVLEELLLRYTESYGGIRDTNRLTSVRIEGTQIQDGQAFDIRIHRKRPDLMRFRIEKGSVRMTTVYDGQRGWVQTLRNGTSNVEELTGPALELLAREARFESPLYRHSEKPENDVSLIGRERIGNVLAFVLRVVENGESASFYFLHPENSRLLRLDRLNEKGELILQTLYRDYRDVEGYPMAHEIENRIDGETASLTRLDSILVNAGILSIYFDKPS